MTKRYNLTGVSDAVEIGEGGPIISNAGGKIQIDGEDIPSITLIANVTSTGTLGSAVLSINADPTLFDLTIDDGVVVDHTYGTATPLTYVGTLNFVGIASPLIATHAASYIGLDETGTIVYSSSPFTADERRTIIDVGIIVHTDNVNITSAITAPKQSQDQDQLLNDLIDAVGPMNLSGNVIAPVDTTLAIKRTAGVSFGRSVSYDVTPASPNFKNSAEESPLMFFTNYRDATTGVNVGVSSLVDPNFYDDGSGTLAAIPVGGYVVHRVTYFATDDSVILQYGQDSYTSLVDAERGYLQEQFEERNDFSAGIFLGWLFLQEGTTDLSAAFAAGLCNYVQSGQASGSSGGDTFNPAADQTITGLWDFDTATSNRFSISNDPTFASPSILYAWADHDPDFDATAKVRQEFMFQSGTAATRYLTINDSGNVANQNIIQLTSGLSHLDNMVINDSAQTITHDLNTGLVTQQTQHVGAGVGDTQSQTLNVNSGNNSVKSGYSFTANDNDQIANIFAGSASITCSDIGGVPTVEVFGNPTTASGVATKSYVDSVAPLTPANWATIDVATIPDGGFLQEITLDGTNNIIFTGTGLYSGLNVELPDYTGLPTGWKFMIMTTAVAVSTTERLDLFINGSSTGGDFIHGNNDGLTVSSTYTGFPVNDGPMVYAEFVYSGNTSIGWIFRTQEIPA